MGFQSQCLRLYAVFSPMLSEEEGADEKMGEMSAPKVRCE